MKNTILFLYFLLLIFIISCKKNTDKIFPVINLTSPSENSQYKVLESIAVRASISDNERIKRIQVSLFESVTNKQVLSTLIYSPGTNVFELAVTYSLSDSLLPSGLYYFKIEAKDDENTSTVFQHIRVNGISKEVISVFAICADNTNTTLYADKNDFNFQLFSTFSEPYFTAVLNSYDQQFWFAPKNKGNVMALQLNKKKIEFEQGVNSSYNMPYTDLKLNDRTVLVSTKDGDVWGINSSYNRNYNYQSLSSRTINCLNANNKYIVIDEVDLVGSSRFANVLYRNTGAVKLGIPIIYPVQELYFVEEEKAILFQNDENGGRITELNIADGAKRTVSTFSDSVLQAVQLSGTEYLISTPTKVVHFNYKNGNLLDYLMVPRAVIIYESLNNQVYVASGNQLEMYTYPFQSVIRSASLPNDIKGIQIRYNR